MELGFPNAATDWNHGIVLPATARPEVVACHAAPARGAGEVEDQGFDILGLDASAFAARIRRDRMAYAAGTVTAD